MSMRYLYIQYLLVLMPLSQACFADSFFQDHTRGWHWYETLPIIEDQLEEKIKEQNPKERTQQQAKSPTEIVKAYREELESRLHKAWIYPTPQNIQSYQEMQKDLTKRSKIFSTVWMQNVFQYPDLDHTLISPVNQQARHLQIDLEKERINQTIKNLSESYGLFFFFSGDCPYCHQFAPIVKRFADNYDWKVIAISVDADASGRGNLAEFPNAEADHGLSEIWGLKALPALFAVNPTTKEAIPIAYGLTSLDEMENRIMTLLGERS